jgi:hypothetical protein
VTTSRQQLEERGWAIFPSVVHPDRCRELIDALERIWQDLGEPALHSRTDVRLGESVLVSPVGMAVHDLLDRLPRGRELLLPGPVARFVETVLGTAPRLEVASAVLSDHTRPFFLWHHHVGGVLDARDYLTHAVRYPTFRRIERLSCTLYPVPLDDEHGVMLVHPRRIADPTEPPYPDLEVPWPVQEVVRCPAGSVLVADQCLWHAVTPMGRRGRRAFAAGFLVPAGPSLAAPSNPGGP